MNFETTEKKQRSYARAVRRAWLTAVRESRTNPQNAQAAAEKFASTVVKRAIDAGYAESRHLGTGIFDPTASTNRLKDFRNKLITDFTQSPANVAGLTPRQTLELRTFRNVLENAQDNPLELNPRAQQRSINRQVNRLARSMTDTRANFIGRTIANAALHLGVEEAINQNLFVVEVEKIWHTRRDEDVRNSHAPMDGQVRDFNQPFTTSRGNSLMIPGDPAGAIEEIANCRCFFSTRIKANG